VRVFLAGATGVIGSRLLPRLLVEGHEVTAMTRSPERGERLTAAGAVAVIADALDEQAVRAAVGRARPQAVIHQLTALPKRIDPRRIERDFALNDRLRDEGTRILASAAGEVGAERLIAQSIAFMYEPGAPGAIHDEDDPLLGEPPPSFARSAAAVKALERTVLAAGGTVLRYGYFYGPGTSIATRGSLGEEVAKRRLPVVGGGHGVWSFVHVDDAVSATAAALTRGETGAYNVVDDEPAPVREWVPALARALGAKRPRNVPAWLARPLAGEYGVYTMTRAQGASNARAKAQLGWTPRFANWRDGFRTGLG
jgi:nucleoside-diphosphate-sugar epimerase